LESERINWSWHGRSMDVRLERRGHGPAVLLLPALSSISTFAEMRPLAERLAPHFMTLSIDWPGFGDLPRPAVAWEPAAYCSFLADMLQKIPKPVATVRGILTGCFACALFQRLRRGESGLSEPGGPLQFGSDTF
jgi:hypothetical protein